MNGFPVFEGGQAAFGVIDGGAGVATTGSGIDASNAASVDSVCGIGSASNSNIEGASARTAGGAGFEVIDFGGTGFKVGTEEGA